MLKNIQGITIIELLIVLVIVGILTTVSYSSLLQYLLKIHRADAIMGLTHTQLLLERCYAQNFSYSKACDALPATSLLSPQGFYSISISNLKASTYSLTATPLGNQTKDETCSRIIIDQANVKTATDSFGTEQFTCWSK